MTTHTIAVAALLAFGSGTAGGCVERLIDDGPKDAVADDDVEHNIDLDAACEEDMECGANEACFEGVCVGAGSLRFSLSWTVETDFDLHISTPSGDHVHFAVPYTDYGHLDVDDCVDNACLDPQGVHVENVYFEENAPRGTYSVWVQNFNGARAGSYEINVVGEVNQNLAGNVPGTERGEGPRHDVVWQ